MRNAKTFLIEFSDPNHDNCKLHGTFKEASFKHGNWTDKKAEILIPWLIKQQYKCRICEESFKKPYSKNAHLDHNWWTGLLRALLCKDCNNGLGVAKENIEHIDGCIERLEKHHNKEEGYKTTQTDIKILLTNYCATYILLP